MSAEKVVAFRPLIGFASENRN